MMAAVAVRKKITSLTDRHHPTVFYFTQ